MSLENRTACIEMSDINGRVGSGSKTNSVDLCYSNVSGLEILKNPKYCKGLAFSIEERQILGEIFFSELLYSDAASRWAVWTLPHREFGSSVNPILRRPQNFAKSPPIICPMYCQSNK